MTDFQVGDRVSVEGVVTQALDTGAYVHLNYPQPINHFFPTECITLVERPKRKLRVGSVWEHPAHGRYVVVPDDYSGRVLRGLDQGVIMPITWLSDSWREVPVEELEREARS